ncbi:hypothetical protein PR048_012988 [Dryococelus australis]|uniref:Uncharacterized protein n=1 Tax=Dryococelus australis TaxID=614101 RepID=A0ABQ9HRR5_9NEOP|nr:hypothetical protein PR048_012988 [Dryococelus australis]
MYFVIQKSAVLFLLATDASHFKNRKMFPVVVIYFDPLIGIKNKLLDFVERADEMAEGIYTMLRNNLESHSLNVNNISSYCADNASKLLCDDNDKIYKANCINHIIHNGTKHACDTLDIDIKMVVVKIYGLFQYMRRKEGMN